MNSLEKSKFLNQEIDAGLVGILSLLSLLVVRVSAAMGPGKFGPYVSNIGVCIPLFALTGDVKEAMENAVTVSKVLRIFAESFI